MGLVYADVELINGDDLAFARRHIIGEDEIKRMYVNIIVDTGSYMLAINENIKEQLQLQVVETRKAQTATGQIVECEVVAPVELRFKNHSTTCRTIVMPGATKPIIGESRKMGDMVRLPNLNLQ